MRPIRQALPFIPSAGRSSTPASSVARVLQQPGAALDSATRTNFEARFQQDFSGVRVHTDDESAQSARLLHAAAYTTGPHIVMGAGRYRPNSHEGLHLLAHELAHTVQQRSVARSAAPASVAPADSSAEHEAAAAASQVVFGTAVPQIHARVPPSIQRVPDDGGASVADPEKELGERLIKDFSDGVSVAFYADGLDEAQGRASAWAGVHDAIAPKKSKIQAKELVFGKAISDTMKLPDTMKAISAVMTSAVAKANTTGTPPDKPAKFKNVAIFAHGTTDWCGLSSSLTTSTAAATIKTIAPVVTPDLTVLLFTCNSARSGSETESWTQGTLEGGGVKSLASEVRNAMVDEKIDKGSVWGHTTHGHISRNFALRSFSAADGKDSKGTAFAGERVWPMYVRLGYVQELEMAAAASGYVIDDAIKPRFLRIAMQEIDTLIYKCYAQGNKNLTLSGLNLAEMAPTHPDEVGALLRDYWNTNFWTDGKRTALALDVAQQAKLKKAPVTPSPAGPK